MLSLASVLLSFYIKWALLAFEPLALITGAYFVYFFYLKYKQKFKTIERFAASNGFGFAKNVKYSSIGVLFQVGNPDHATPYLLSGKFQGHKGLVYAHTFSTGSGKNKITRSYMVAEIDLTKRLPDIFLDYKNNDLFGTDILDIFKRRESIELEGNFNKYFQVFGPSLYSTEVLTILNPAFMQALLDFPYKFEVEINDSRLFIYISCGLGGNSFLTESSLKRTLNAANFMITELNKQLDTFKFEINPKAPNSIQKSALKELF